ncbi:hypothetical protein [Mesorhizobium sp.]|uniref:hypothetical protein n=1 Tax=Mesorhizobium sp. TaxID=1871066 RepID=UPI0025DE4A51|nr:hypothetical protein [Mesorhizobium sp.]
MHDGARPGLLRRERLRATLPGNLVLLAMLGLIVRRACKTHIGRKEKILLPGRAFGVAAEIGSPPGMTCVRSAGLANIRLAARAAGTLSLGVIGRNCVQRIDPRKTPGFHAQDSL